MKWPENLIKKWRRRTPSERYMLVEAFLLLGVVRLIIFMIPFKLVARSLGVQMRETTHEVDPVSESVARQIGAAVRSAAFNTPWQSVCLPQAIVGQWMLKRRGIAGTVYLGVKKDAAKPGNFAAHAWLRCGNTILTGGSGMQRFTVVGFFGTQCQGMK